MPSVALSRVPIICLKPTWKVNETLLSSDSIYSCHRYNFYFTAPSEVPTNVRAEPKSATTVKITWKSPTHMKVPQNVDGYYVGYREHRAMNSVPHPSASAVSVSLGSDTSNRGGYTFKAVDVPDYDKYTKQDELELTIQNLKRNKM